MAKSTKSSGKRTLIEPKGDKRYVRRNAQGQFTESDDVSRSLSQDVKKSAKTKVKPGQGDKGDQPKKKGAQKNRILQCFFNIHHLRLKHFWCWLNGS